MSPRGVSAYEAVEQQERLWKHILSFRDMSTTYRHKEIYENGARRLQLARAWQAPLGIGLYRPLEMKIQGTKLREGSWEVSVLVVVGQVHGQQQLKLDHEPFVPGNAGA